MRGSEWMGNGRRWEGRRVAGTVGKGGGEKLESGDRDTRVGKKVATSASQEKAELPRLARIRRNYRLRK